MDQRPGPALLLHQLARLLDVYKRQALSRALENYAIIGDREEGTPGRKGDKALLRAIQVLEAVREEGRDKAEWNMRMRCV